MKTVALIACVSGKKKTKSAAIDLYNTDLFNKSVAYCVSQRVDDIYILSAKYGLVSQYQLIEPYDLTLKNMNIAERRAWSTEVLLELKSKENISDTKFIVLAGNNYRADIMNALPISVVPLKGLGIGKQLQWLKNNT